MFNGVVSFRIFGKGGNAGLELKGGHASCTCVTPRGVPPENFEISDAQGSHFMPSELNHV